MYFVNRSDIEKKLDYIDSLWKELNNKGDFSTTLENLALERMAHVMIESTLDVGNHMIDGFIMRDPGSYHDIIDILIDEKVIPSEHGSSYKKLIDLRQMLVQDYLTVDHQKIKDVLFSNKETFMQFSKHVKTYLDNELGVANAFSNES
mgnify:FL=1